MSTDATPPKARIQLVHDRGFTTIPTKPQPVVWHWRKHGRLRAMPGLRRFLRPPMFSTPNRAFEWDGHSEWVLKDPEARRLSAELDETRRLGFVYTHRIDTEDMGETEWRLMDRFDEVVEEFGDAVDRRYRWVRRLVERESA